MRIFMVFIMILLFAPGFEAQSQQSRRDTWYLGKIKLADSTTLSGRIKYQLKYNVLMHKANGKIKTFTAKSIDYFEIQEKDFKNTRRYYSIPIKINENRILHQFFEVVAKGSMTLLKREEQVRKRMGKRTVVSMVDRFYYMDESGFVHNLVPSKRNILKLMHSEAVEIGEFMEDLDLNPTKATHLKQLFIYYNNLRQSSD